MNIKTNISVLRAYLSILALIAFSAFILSTNVHADSKHSSGKCNFDAPSFSEDGDSFSDELPSYVSPDEDTMVTYSLTKTSNGFFRCNYHGRNWAKLTGKLIHNDSGNETIVIDEVIGMLGWREQAFQSDFNIEKGLPDGDYTLSMTILGKHNKGRQTFKYNFIKGKKFTLSSDDLKPGETIPLDFVHTWCGGNNFSPSLVLNNPPKGTKSFVITVHDPDATTLGAGWWHWMIVEIPYDEAVDQDAIYIDGSNLPVGSREIRNDFSVAGWGGPCPPAGESPHRYNFSAYALNESKLPDWVSLDATASAVGFAANTLVIGKASFTSYYGH